MEVKPIISYDLDINIYEDEIKMKGYCNNVTVTLSDHSSYKVCFYDHVRLVQDMEEEICIAEPGLIIVKEVTRINMEQAVYKLWLDGYFEKLQAV